MIMVPLQSYRKQSRTFSLSGTHTKSLNFTPSYPPSPGSGGAMKPPPTEQLNARRGKGLPPEALKSSRTFRPASLFCSVNSDIVILSGQVGAGTPSFLLPNYCGPLCPTAAFQDRPVVFARRSSQPTLLDADSHGAGVSWWDPTRRSSQPESFWVNFTR